MIQYYCFQFVWLNIFRLLQYDIVQNIYQGKSLFFSSSELLLMSVIFSVFLTPYKCALFFCLSYERRTKIQDLFSGDHQFPQHRESHIGIESYCQRFNHSTITKSIQITRYSWRRQSRIKALNQASGAKVIRKVISCRFHRQECFA